MLISRHFYLSELMLYAGLKSVRLDVLTSIVVSNVGQRSRQGHMVINLSVI